MNDLLHDAKTVKLDDKKSDIRNLLPFINVSGVLERQSRLNLYRNIRKEEQDRLIISGFPLQDERHHLIKSPHGFVDGTFVGFMDDCTPVRIYQDTLKRQSNKPDRIWFRLDNDIKGINKAKCFNGPADNRSYCAYDLASAKATCTWFGITKALNGRYPLWANQYDIWPPNITPELETYWHALCFAFVLSENRCVVTKFEKDNPVPGAPEVYVDNPLCPTNSESFWSTALASEVECMDKNNLARLLTDNIKELYRYWNINYCKGQILENVGLHNEPYFKYFDYPDFLTPCSGLIQIRKYAELEGASDLLTRFNEISELTRKVRDELYRLLVKEFGYFE